MLRQLLAFSAMAGAGACSSGDLVVFESEPSGATSESSVTSTSTGGGASSSGTLTTGRPRPAEPTAATKGDCTTDADCSSSWFCSKDACEASHGFCRPRPVFCPEEPAPVCGCDGVTYWNECVRQQLGVVASQPGECQSSAVRCRSGADCGFTGAHCARLLFPGQSCPQAGSPRELGTCWAVPPNCSDAGSLQRWYLCPPPELSPRPGAICGDTCQAIRSELPHLRDEPVCNLEP